MPSPCFLLYPLLGNIRLNLSNSFSLFGPFGRKGMMSFSITPHLTYIESYIRSVSYIKNGPYGRRLTTISPLDSRSSHHLQLTPSPHVTTTPPSLEPPPQRSFKLNFDGSVSDNSAAACIIIQDSVRDILAGSTFNLNNASVFIVEATTFT